MIHKIAGESESIWKELAEMAVKKAVSTFVSESVKASVEIWKTRQLKEIDVEFEERARARKSEKGDKDKAEKDKSDEEKSEEEDSEEEESEEEEDSETPDDKESKEPDEEEESESRD